MIQEEEREVGLHLADSPLRASRAFERYFRAPPAFVAPKDLEPIVRDAARAAWEDRARAEYTGVMIVRRFHGLLVDCGAPLDVQELALRMLHDEQAHTATCAAAARALGSDLRLSFPLADLQQARTSAPIEEQLLEMIVCTFAVGEVAALALLSHALQALPPSPYRDALKDIARDEVLHASIGPALLRLLRDAADDAFVPWPGDDAARALAARYRDWMRSRDVVEPDEAALFEDPARAAALMGLGVPPSAPFKAAYLAALDEDVPRAFAQAGLPLA